MILINFDRLYATHCSLCNETHHKDNTLYLWLSQKDHKQTVYESCRHCKGHSNQLGHLEDNTTKDMQGVLINHIKDLNNDCVDCSKNVDSSSNFDLTNVEEYNKPSMKDYKLAETLLVRAQMKLGKTRALRKYLDTYFPHGKVIRFVTFRQSFSQSLQSIFPDFKSYKDIPGEIGPKYSHAIVQAESLHRISITKKPIDLLIIDESESTLAQFCSGLHKHFASSFASFKWMMNSAKHVICMDADLGDRTYNTVKKMRSSPIHLHWNKYSHAKDDKFYFTTNMGDWIEHLLNAIHNGQKIVVPVNSLKDGKFIEEMIHKSFKDKQVRLYSSETLPSVKKEHFSNVHTYWSDLDVLIYTPTVSAGVSFELEHFDALYACFNDSSCDVETCRQMLARVRNLRTQEHFICFRLFNSCHDLPVTTEDISCILHDKRSGLYQQITDPALHFEHTIDGNIKFYKSDYFHLWLETERIKNLSKNSFMYRFIDQIKYTGAAINALPASDAKISKKHCNTYKSIKNDIENAHCEAVSKAEDLSPDEFHSICDRLNNEEDVSIEEKNAVKKYQLQTNFKYTNSSEITPAFVKNYSKPVVKNVYDNLNAITQGKTLNESLLKIREYELTNYDAIMSEHISDHDATEAWDLLNERKSHPYQAHRLAVGILCRSGFQCIQDKNSVQDDVLEKNIRDMLPVFEKHMDKLLYEFEIRKVNVETLKVEKDRGKFLKRSLTFINSILRKMYGIQIHKSRRKGSSSYIITQSSVGKLFVFVEENETVPSNINKPVIISRLEKSTTTTNNRTVKGSSHLSNVSSTTTSRLLDNGNICWKNK